MGTADMMTVGSMSVSQYTANMQILAKSISHNRMSLRFNRKPGLTVHASFKKSQSTEDKPLVFEEKEFSGYT